MSNTFLKISNALDIPGLTSPEQHFYYKILANELPKNPRVLEIGCGWGRSTWAWLNVLPSSTKYCIVDNFELPAQFLLFQYETYQNKNPIIAKLIKEWAKNNTNQRKIFDKLISQHPNKKILKKIWHLHSDNWIGSEEFTDNWDLVFLDDRHYFDVMERWLEIFSHVPIVCGDDYAEDFPELVKAVDEYVLKNKQHKKLVVRPGRFFYIIKNKLTN